MLALRLILFSFLFIGSLSHAKENTILVLGDSLSAAYGIEIEHGWVNLLQKKLNQNFSGTVQWNVVNASVSGETTAGGLARLPNLLKKYQPDICILELGANNGLRGQSLNIMEEQLNNLITQCKKYGSILF